MEEKLKDLLKILHSKKSDKYYEEINRLSDNWDKFSGIEIIEVNQDSYFEFGKQNIMMTEEIWMIK